MVYDGIGGGAWSVARDSNNNVYVVGAFNSGYNYWWIKKFLTNVVGGESVPEWSDYALMLIALVALGGFLAVRRK